MEIKYPFKGKRLPDVATMEEFTKLEPGDYIKVKAGDYGVIVEGQKEVFLGMSPNGLVCSLRNHIIKENEDGTITVEPSIFINQNREPCWHGFLINGNWQLTR